MTRNRITIDVSSLPWPEDVIVQTSIPRAGWLFGIREIARALETPESTVYGWLEQGRIKAHRVRNPDRRTVKINSFTWMASKDDVTQFYKAHISPALAANNSKPQLVDMRSGVSLPSEQSIAELTQAVTGLRSDVQHLGHDIQELSRVVNRNTEVWKG